MERKFFNIVLLGKTGSGKSSTGNTILRRNVFYSLNSTDSVTRCSQLQCSEFDDMLIKVVDTPGLMDTKMSNEEILQNIFNAMSLCPEGFNALVFVMKHNQRFTEEEQQVLYLLKNAFGESFVKDFCIVVMTGGDDFDIHNEDKGDGYTIDHWLNEQTGPPAFLSLLAECSRRVVLFYNVGKIYYYKREDSMKMFWELVKSRPGAYTSGHFQACVKQRNAMIAKLKLPAQTQFVQEQLSLAGQNIQKIMDMMNSMTQVKDKVTLEKTNSIIQSELDLLINKIHAILTEVQKNDNGTGVMATLTEDLRKFQMEIEGRKESSKNITVQRLRDLEASLKSLKETGVEKVHEGFSVTGTCMAGGAAVGSTVGLGIGIASFNSMAATTAATITGGAAATTILAPIVVIGATGALLGYGFKKLFFN